MDFTQKVYELKKKYIDEDNVEISIDIRNEFYKYEKLLKRNYRLWKLPEIINLPITFNQEEGIIVEIEKDKIFLLMNNGKTIIIDEANFYKLFKIKNPLFNNIILKFPFSKSDNFNKAIEVIESNPNYTYTKQIIDNKKYIVFPIIIDNFQNYNSLLDLVYRFKNTHIKSNDFTISGYHAKGILDCFYELLEKFKATTAMVII